MDKTAESLLSFWFDPAPCTREELEQLFHQWFEPDDALDARIAERFGEAARRAARSDLDHWRHEARSRLALILLLDQVPRHLHRGTAAAFAQDDKALGLTLEGIKAGMDFELPILQRGFFYIPLQHAEDADVQALSVRKFEALRAEPAPPFYGFVLDSMAEYARLHRDIVERFGRFPHRNRALGRDDTPAEREFLRDGGPRFGQ